jgi:hypothetical protein
MLPGGREIRHPASGEAQAGSRRRSERQVAALEPPADEEANRPNRVHALLSTLGARRARGREKSA